MPLIINLGFERIPGTFIFRVAVRRCDGRFVATQSTALILLFLLFSLLNRSNLTQVPFGGTQRLSIALDEYFCTLFVLFFEFLGCRTISRCPVHRSTLAFASLFAAQLIKLDYVAFWRYIETLYRFGRGLKDPVH